MDWLFAYYGVDWLATAGTLVSMWLLGSQRRLGFLIGMAAAIGWFAFGALASSPAALLANALLFGINVRGYWRWQTP